MTHWAIDFGTTHTRVARWDGGAAAPKLVELPEICRRPGGEDPLEAPRLVPSATHVLETRGLLAKLGRVPFLRPLIDTREALIGRPAIEHNSGVNRPEFAPSFKIALAAEPLRPLARAGRRTVTAREVARLFAGELFAEIKRATGERVRSATLTAPVEAYEAYRAEWLAILRSLGVRKVRFVDEPVAAALGYGLSLRDERLVLVVDFGGGTLHVALVALSARGVEAGACRVIAKEGRLVGGRLVDQWILRDFCDRLGYALSDDPDDETVRYWYRLMLGEACRVKEAVFFKEATTFRLTPPTPMQRLEPKACEPSPHPFTRERLVEIIRKNGLYAAIEECLEGVRAKAGAEGARLEAATDVVMVGGSSLLPGVYPIFEERFGRDKVRAWQPFEAVAFGACAFAAERFSHSDYIVHDYAFVTYDAKTNEPRYTVIVPRGTRFPTAPDLWKRQLVPTCSLGEPETMFKLVVCEIGRSHSDARRFSWDSAGNVHALGAGAPEAKESLVVPLNESNPTLGYLDPPHPPSDKRPRLEIAFGVNEDRWLCATVVDLRTQKTLMRDASVVRLL